MEIFLNFVLFRPYKDNTFIEKIKKLVFLREN